MVDPIGQTIRVFETLAKALAPGMEAAGIQWYIFWFVFFLSYVLIYSLLQYIHFLKDNNNAKLVVALVMAFIISSNGWALAIIGDAFPSLGVLLAIGLSILILTVLFIPDMMDRKNTKILSLLALAFISVYIISIFFTSGAISSSSDYGGVTNFLEAYLGIIIAMFIILGLIMFLRGGKEPRPGEAGGLDKIVDLFRDAGKGVKG